MKITDIGLVHEDLSEGIGVNKNMKKRKKNNGMESKIYSDYDTSFFNHSMGSDAGEGISEEMGESGSSPSVVSIKGFGLYHPLEEANLNRIANGHDYYGFVILSPCLSKDRLSEKLNEQVTEDELIEWNVSHMKQMKKDLTSLNLSYTRVLGGYKYQGSDDTSYEVSYIVYPYDVKMNSHIQFSYFFKDLIKLAEDYYQESIMISEPGVGAYLYSIDDKQKVSSIYKNKKLNDLTQEYFTAIKYDKDNPRRVTFTEGYVISEESVLSMMKLTSSGEQFYKLKEAKRDLQLGIKGNWIAEDFDSSKRTDIKVVDLEENLKGSVPDRVSLKGQGSFVTLREANLNRISNGHDESGYSIVSACFDENRFEDHDKDKEWKNLKQYNYDRTSDLRKAIQELGYSYTRVLGGYKYSGDDESKTSYEVSFVVYPYLRSNESVNFGEFVRDMIDLGGEFEQQSILIYDPQKGPYYFDFDDPQSNENPHVFKGKSFNDVSKEYFTATKYYKGDKNENPQRYTFTDSYVYSTGDIGGMRICESNGELFYRAREADEELKSGVLGNWVRADWKGRNRMIDKASFIPEELEGNGRVFRDIRTDEYKVINKDGELEEPSFPTEGKAEEYITEDTEKDDNKYCSKHGVMLMQDGNGKYCPKCRQEMQQYKSNEPVNEEFSYKSVKNKLIEMDKRTDFKYNLTMMYESLKLNRRLIFTINEGINNKSVKEVYEMLDRISNALHEDYEDDEYVNELADEAYSDWVADGKKSRPAEEFFRELGLWDRKDVYESESKNFDVHSETMEEKLKKMDQRTNNKYSIYETFSSLKINDSDIHLLENKLKVCDSPKYIREFLDNFNYHVENEIFDLYEDGRSFKRLTESNLNRISKGHNDSGYAIISASRNFDNTPEAKNEQQWEDINNKKTKKMMNMLKNLGYSYVRVYGSYIEDGSDKRGIEKSFVVYPYDRKSDKYADFEQFANNIIDLGNKFEQDSVLIAPPNDSPRYIDCKTGEEDMRFDGNPTINDTTQDYFTSLKNWSDNDKRPERNKNKDFSKGKPQRFTFESIYYQCNKSFSGQRVDYYNNEFKG